VPTKSEQRREETCEVVKSASGCANKEEDHVEKLASWADIEEVLDMVLAMQISGCAQLT
jgi:hypothetical protein